jgi:protein TonB
VPYIGPPNGGVVRKKVDIDEDPVDPFPPIPAEYKGGSASMQKFINEQIRYPEIDRTMGVQGTVYVSFVIERDGSVSNVKIERGVSETIDREAKRVVKMLNQWIPAQNAFGKVRTNAFLPINFRLDE